MLVTLDTYRTAMEHLQHFPVLVVDTETTGLEPWRGDRVAGIAIKGYGSPKSYYFAFRHGSKYGESGNLPPEKLGPLRSLLDDKVHIGFNYGYDMKMMFVDGFKLPSKIEDVLTAAHLINENEETFKLKKLGTKYVDPQAEAAEQELDDYARSLGLDPKKDMWRLPASKVEAYACQDVVLTEKLRDFYYPHLQTWKIATIWQEVNDYLYEIVRAETLGMSLNVPLIHQYMEESAIKTAESRKVLEKLAGYAINPNSAKQLQAWLGIPSTAAEILEGMQGTPGVKELLEYRWWSKVNANYYTPFLHFAEKPSPYEPLDFVYPVNPDVLHPNLNLTGTISGRLSASKPPMQAIPVRDEVYKVKDVFVARPGKRLIEADYGQAELRVGSHYAQDKVMSEKLTRGADIHTETAEENGIPRDAAKRMNFSVIYGIGKRKLAERLKIKESIAGQYLDKYHARYPGFRRLYRRCESIAQDRGYIRMFTGRLRRFNVKEAYTHKASSNLIQGSVAEMMRLAFTKCAKTFGDSARPLLQVHDSIIFEADDERVEELLPEIHRIMEHQPWCSVPQKVDIKTGPHWGAMKKENL